MQWQISKITKIEGKIPSISALATNAASTTVENKIFDVSSLVKKTNSDTKITEIEKKLIDHNHDNYITTPEFNALADSVFNVRLAQANLITKTDFDAKVSSLNRKITWNKSKHVLVENKLKKLKTFHSSYFRGKSHFEEDGTQNWVFQPMYKYFRRTVGVGTGNYIYFWKSNGLSDENITAPTTSDYNLNPQLSYLCTKTRVKFDGSCLKQDKTTFNHEKVVNIYIVYEITKVIHLSVNDNRQTIANALFGAVSLTKNADIGKYQYFGYGDGFDRRSNFSFSGGGFGQNVMIFGVDMSSSTKIDSRKKDIWF